MPNDDDARLIIPMTGRDPPDLNNLARLNDVPVPVGNQIRTY